MQQDKKAETRELTGDHASVRCGVCGRKIDPAACSWEEDDGGTVYCMHCRDEKESCGCSD